MVPINGSIVNIALPTITEFFKSSISTSQWIIMSYLLTLSSLILFYGRLGDLYGHERLYLAGIIGFIISSILCGIAFSIESLIIFRAIQGITAGMIISVAIAIVTKVFPAYERGKALGIHALGIAAGLVMGPTIGGLITGTFGWRSIFFVSVPVGILSLLWCLKTLDMEKTNSVNLSISGAFFQFICVFFTVYLLNYIQKEGLNYISLVLGFIITISFVLFVRNEHKTENPTLNLSLFKNSRFSLGSLSLFFNYICTYMVLFIMPFYLQRVLHYDAYLIGIILTTNPLMIMLISPISGFLSDKIGFRPLTLIGSAICALSLFSMGELTMYSSIFDIIWRLAFFGFGVALFQSPNNSSIMGSAPRDYIGTASSVLVTMRNMGMVFGISIAGILLYNSVSPSILQIPELFNLNAYHFTEGTNLVFRGGGILSIFMAILSIIEADICTSKIKEIINKAKEIKS